jgi:hypothetical membrane protein
MLGLLITTLILVVGARLYRRDDSDTYVLDLLEIGGVYAILFLADLTGGSIVSLALIFTVCRLTHLIYGVSRYKLARSAQWTLIAEYLWMLVALFQTSHYGSVLGLAAITTYRMSRWVIANNASTTSADYKTEFEYSKPTPVLVGAKTE